MIVKSKVLKKEYLHNKSYVQSSG